MARSISLEGPPVAPDVNPITPDSALWERDPNIPGLWTEAMKAQVREYLARKGKAGQDAMQDAMREQVLKELSDSAYYMPSSYVHPSNVAGETVTVTTTTNNTTPVVIGQMTAGGMSPYANYQECGSSAKDDRVPDFLSSALGGINAKDFEALVRKRWNRQKW